MYKIVENLFIKFNIILIKNNYNNFLNKSYYIMNHHIKWSNYINFIIND